MVAYARKQSKFAIFEWQEKEKGWYLYTGEYLVGWKKKGSMSQTAKPESAKRGDNSSETYSDIVPYGSGLPPIGNIVLERSPPLSAFSFFCMYIYSFYLP